MREKAFSAVILSLVLLSTTCTAAIASDIPPPVYGIDIVEYENSVEQGAGTSVMYEVNVKNIGVLGLRDIVLEYDRLPEGWFLSTDSIDLEFDKVGILSYYISVPEGESSFRAFSLIARGNYGVGEVTKIVPVALNVTDGAVTDTTTTQPQATDQLQLDFPELVFSKIRSAVDCVRVGIKGILTDEMLLYKVVAALFVITIALLAVKKFVMDKGKL